MLLKTYTALPNYYTIVLNLIFIIFYCFKCSYIDAFILKYKLTQAQVINACYHHKIKTINLLESF